MNILTVEAPRTTALTTLERMRRELGIPAADTSKDERLTDLIEEASADIVAFCRQPLIRQQVSERQVGFGRTVQTLSLTPVPRGGVSAVRYYDSPISGWSVSNPDAGFVFLSSRFADTRQYNQWIERDPAIMPGNEAYEFDYAGGYLLPGDDVVSSGGCVANEDGFFEITGDTFPILVSGESVVVGGFANAVNNGIHTVIARTPSKLWVSTTLVNDAPSGVVTVQCRTLPRDIESAAVFEIKGRFLSQRKDPSIKSESLGDWSASYGDIESLTGGLSPITAFRLDKYVRLD